MTNAEKHKSRKAQKRRSAWKAMTAYPDDDKEWKEIADNRPVRVLASAIKDSNVEVVNDPGRKYAIDKLCEYATNLDRNCETIWQDGLKKRTEMRIELDKTTNRLDKMRSACQTLHTEMDVAVQCIRSIYRDLKSNNFLTNVEMDILERCAKVLNRRYSISYI